MDLTKEVLLCTFNGSRFVVEQLESILAQSEPVDRISIYDDCSSDDTVAVIERFVGRIPPRWQARITINVNGANVGYATNFAQSIERSTGDVLFLCDQDDVWEIDKVEKLMSILRSDESVEMALSDGSLISEDGALLRGNVLAAHGIGNAAKRRLRERAFADLVRRNFVNGAAVAIRRRAALEALPVPGDMPHDYWLALWCALRGEIALVSQPLYRYRQHGGNAIGIGTRHPLHALAGIWRHARKSRQRDLRIWQAATERLVRLPNHPNVALAQRKLAWLNQVASAQHSRLGRLCAIARSSVNGDYRRFGSNDALLRDLVSVVK
jgi:glycosyltransferase involved in cell wall biosynthesis